MYRSTRVALGLLFAILFCTAPAAFAQGSSGQLSGNVVDANGAVVPGAAIKLTSLATAQEREAITNDSGDFAFTLLPAGDYKLEITATGFRTVVVEQVRVNVTQTTTLPIRLDAAAVSEMVTIQAEAPLVQQETYRLGVPSRKRRFGNCLCRQETSNSCSRYRQARRRQLQTTPSSAVAMRSSQ